MIQNIKCEKVLVATAKMSFVIMATGMLVRMERLLCPQSEGFSET